MQLSDPLTVAFQHNLWANLYLLDACKELTEEQLATDLHGTYGSIRDTLVQRVTPLSGSDQRSIDLARAH